MLLIECHIGRDGAIALAEMLQVNRSLASLWLCGNEVGDVIEEDFATRRQASVNAIDARHRAASVSLRCSAAIRMRAARSILLVVESGRRSTNQTKRGC